MRIWLLWFYHRWQGLGAATIAVLALLLVALLLWRGPAHSVRLLGNADAARVATQGPSGMTLPRSSDSDAGPGMLANPSFSILDTPVRSDDGPQSVAEAQAAWSAAELEQHQRSVLEALNCARREQHLPTLTLDPQLSQAAGEAWLRLARERDFSLAQLDGRYALRSVLPLDTLDRAAASCAELHLDAAALADLGPATRIGIAVFPPQAAWDLASAVILAQ